MNIKEAAEFLLHSALINHEFDCACTVTGKISDVIPCTCGASQHNRDVLIAFQLVRNDRVPIGKVQVHIGIKSPLWKFDSKEQA